MMIKIEEKIKTRRTFFVLIDKTDTKHTQIDFDLLLFILFFSDDSIQA